MMGKFQHPPIFDLAGCLEHGFYFSIYWESSSSQLTNSIIFRGVGLKHQAVMVKSHGFSGEDFPNKQPEAGDAGVRRLGTDRGATAPGRWARKKNRSREQFWLLRMGDRLQ